MVGLSALLPFAAGCSPARQPPPARMAVQEVETPALPGSGEPSVTVTADGRFLLSWIEPDAGNGHALRYAVRRKGEPWSSPTTIAKGTDWFVNWADFPSMAALPDGTLYAHWLARSGPATYSYDVRVARSIDGGHTWNAAVSPHRDGTRTEHGFVSLTPWSAREMGVVWLDGRNTGRTSHDGHGAGQAAMSLMHTTIDRDGRLGAESLLDDRVCDCCQTDAAVADAGTVVVYRDRSAAEVRDMSVVRYVDGRWTEPRPVVVDGWEINGCPVNGPAIAASGAKVAVAWFTAAAEKPTVKVVFSADSAGTFGRPIVVDDGRPLGRVDVVLLDDGSALVSWLEQVGASARVRLRRITGAGNPDDPVTVAESSGARSSGFPRMTRAGGEVLIAWRDGGDPPRVRTAVVATGR
jgi:hypothetical protein